MLPLAFAVAVMLAAIGWPRGAAAWSVGVVATFAAVLLGKLAVFACPGDLASTLRSPSGHTAAAAVVYGGLLALPASRRFRPLPVALLCGGGLALIFGASRLLLGVHTVTDVVVGGLCGVAGLWLMLRLCGPMPRRLMRARPGVALAAAVALCLFTLLLHGHRLAAEPWLHRTALSLRLLRPDCLRGQNVT